MWYEEEHTIKQLKAELLWLKSELTISESSSHASFFVLLFPPSPGNSKDLLTVRGVQF